MNVLGITSFSTTILSNQINDPVVNPSNSFQDDNIEKLFKTAVSLYNQKKFSEALALCTKITKISPTDFRPYMLSGLIYRVQRKLSRASKSFAQASLFRPKDKRLYMLKAHTDRLRNAREEAVTASRKAIEIDPFFFDAHLMIGNILRFDKMRKNEAILAYKTAMKIKPTARQSYEGLGALLLSIGDKQGAVAIFRKGIEKDPDKMAGRFDLGRLMVKDGRLKEARRLWEERTSDIDTTFPNFITLLKRGETLKKAKTQLAKNPTNPKMLLQMGNATMAGASWVVDGRQKRAIVFFKKALELQPGFVQAQYSIVKAYIQIADNSSKESYRVDEELMKLKQLSPALAIEMENYRKTFSGGIGIGSPTNQ